MSSTHQGRVGRDLERLFRVGVAPPGDRELLESFLAEGDESAFEALVERHGPMVLGVCRRLLGSPHEADDAFQATFLVLIRKARGLRDAGRLGPWLHGVATRVAIKARSRAARRPDRPGHEVPDVPAPSGGPAAESLDVRPVLDAELGRLSAKYRDVLVLCLLEGDTAEEASRKLACPLGTVKSRLARGREALRNRLTGRGIAPGVAAAAVAVAVASPSSAAPISESLIRKTLATIASSGPAPAGVVALTRGVAPSMLSKSSTMAALVCGGIALSGLGLATWMKATAQDPRAAGEAPRGGANIARERITQKLMTIMVAFHNDIATNGRLPAASLYGPDGQPKLSWRVALLPYLDENDLFQQFRQDEAWDSPHNKALLARMPAVFETPDLPAGAGLTRIRGFSGKGAIFDGPVGVSLEDVTDGTSNTLTVALARDPVPWTRPGELPFVAGQPPLGLDDTDPAGYLLALADGSVRPLHVKNAGMLGALITRAGGEVVNWPPPASPSELEKPTRSPFTSTPTAPPSTAPMMPGMAAGPVANPPRMMAGMMTAPGAAPPPSPALEARLRGIEEKLELILRKLDAGPSSGGAPNRN